MQWCKPNYVNKDGVCYENCGPMETKIDGKCYNQCKFNDIAEGTKCNDKSYYMSESKWRNWWSGNCDSDYDSVFGFCYKKCKDDEKRVMGTSCAKKNLTYYDRPVRIPDSYKLGK